MNFTNYEMKEYPNDRLPFWCGVNDGFPHWHWHKAPELLFGLEGQSLVYCNDRGHILRPNDTVFVNSDVLHAIESEAGAEYLAISIDPCFFEENQLPLDQFNIQEYIQETETMTRLWQAVYSIQLDEKHIFRVPHYRWCGACAVNRAV